MVFRGLPLCCAVGFPHCSAALSKEFRFVCLLCYLSPSLRWWCSLSLSVLLRITSKIKQQRYDVALERQNRLLAAAKELQLPGNPLDQARS